MYLIHFPDPSHSGSLVHQRAQSSIGHVSHVPPIFKPLRLPGRLWGPSPRWAIKSPSLVRLWHSWLLWTIQNPRKTWLVTGSLLIAFVGDAVSGDKMAWAPCFLPPLAVRHHLPCFMKGPERELACSPLVFNRVILCSVSGPGFTVRVLEPYCRKGLLFFFVSLVFPWFRVLCHISTLRVSSAHSTLTLTTNNATWASALSSHLLQVDRSIWVASPLIIAIQCKFSGFFVFVFCFFFPIMLPSEISKLLS